MSTVNLLPVEIILERKRKVAQGRIVKMTTAVAVVLILGFAALFMLTLQVKRNVTTTETKRLALETEIATYQPVVELQGVVNNKVDMLRLAMGNTFGWRDTMSALGVNIPANVWLTNVAVTRDSEQGFMTLRGLTYNHPSTASWVESLQGIEGVSDVRVSFSAAEETDDEKLVRFEVRAVVGVGDLYEPLKRGEDNE
ncbi:MAG: PilN domain-containing protein [Firmicutes bacterium]|nr:PilN domain-containing protein [Bacillota bacterium]